MPDPTLLLPADPLNERAVDDVFTRDRDAARELGFATMLVDHDLLSGADHEVRIRGLRDADARLLYRGWMMTADAYAALESSVAAAGSSLMTTAEQFRAAHHLPGWVEIFADLTPATVFVSADATADDIRGAAAELSTTRFVVKDWVKSRKHEWDSAAYAPDVDVLPMIVAEFVRLQEEFLVGEVAIREFVDLDRTAPEVRVWWAHGRVVLVTPHPDFSGSSLPPIPSAFVDRVRSAVENLGNPFVTTDLARTASGSWIVIEVGDGQVSGFPESVTDEEVRSVLVGVLVGE